jgi:NADH-quinone oxidoreductase subunit M
VPWLATAFVVVTLSSVGLPGTNGFVGEFLILSGTWLSRLASGQVLATLGAVGVILGAVYMLLLVEKVFFGPLRNPANAGLPDVSVREGFVLVPMIALIVVMGLLPQPFLDPAKSSVDRLVARFQQAEARLGVPSSVGTVPPAVRTAAVDGPGFPIQVQLQQAPPPALPPGGAH